MIRILFVIPTLDRSGAEKQLTLLATRLPRDEFTVEVCALTRGGPYEAELRASGIPVIVLGKRAKLDPLAFFALGKHIAKNNYDIVHTWLFAANSYGRLAARRNRVPILIASERCADHWKGTMEIIVDRFLEPSTDSIVANSHAVADYYLALGIPPEKITIIPNGIVPQNAYVADRAAALAEFDIPSHAQVLGFVGRLWPQKRVRDLIWATEVIRNIKPNVFALIVGDGPQRAELERFTRDVHIEHRVRFVGHREDVARLLACMDVFVLPSEFEGMPNVVLEAMLAGLPVLATNIPGTNEVVQDGVTGFLVAVGDSRAFIAQCNRLLDQELLRRQFGAAGRQRVLEHFSVDKMVRSHVELYQSLVARKENSRSTCAESVG